MVLEPAQIAIRLRVDVETVRRWIRAGKLIATNVGSEKQPDWRVSESDLEGFMKSRRNVHIPSDQPDVVEN